MPLSEFFHVLPLHNFTTRMLVFSAWTLCTQESAEAAQADIIRSLTAQRDAAEAARGEAEQAADEANAEIARLRDVLQARAAS